MPRIRSIKPEFFLDEDLARLAPLDRLIFVGLWCQADREGRIEDRPGRLKVQVAPYDDVDMKAALDRLAAAGFLVRYTVESRAYIQVRTFLRHQRPHKTEQPSVLPPLENGTRTVVAPLSNGSSTVGERSGMEEGMEEEEGKGKEAEEIPSESPSPSVTPPVKRKTDPLILDLKNRLGSGVRICGDQVRALRGVGWDDARIAQAISEFAEPGMAPWEWTKKARGVVPASGSSFKTASDRADETLRILAGGGA